MKIYLVFEHTRYHPKFVKAFKDFNEAIDFVVGLPMYIEDYIIEK